MFAAIKHFIKSNLSVKFLLNCTAYCQHYDSACTVFTITKLLISTNTIAVIDVEFVLYKWKRFVPFLIMG